MQLTTYSCLLQLLLQLSLVVAQNTINYPSVSSNNPDAKSQRNSSSQNPADPEIQRDVLYILERTAEPIALPKGPNGTVVFDVQEENKIKGVDLVNGTSGRPMTVVPLEKMEGEPEIGTAASIPRNTVFSAFHRTHRQAAHDLIKYLKSAKSPKQFIARATRVRDMINESLFIYAVTFVIRHRPDLKKVQIPAVSEVIPQYFITEETLQKAQEQVNVRKFMDNPPDRIVVDHGFDRTGTNLNPENKLAYWREDYGINSFHWHWHIVNPYQKPEYRRDRKGELFYYVHQQIVARYNHERLSNGLNRVQTIGDFNAPLPEGYFPKLTIQNSGRHFGGRSDNVVMKSTKRGDFDFENLQIPVLELHRDRLYTAIHQGWLVDGIGQRIPLNDSIDILTSPWKRGIDFLGDAIESDPIHSVNYHFYGDPHNHLHLLISFAPDPDGRHLEERGVMADSMTAMRDPQFYKLHKFCDDLFDAYKVVQFPYEDNELAFDGVVMEKLSVNTAEEGALNTIFTGWDRRLIEASRGLDFSEKRDVPILVRLSHINHKPFVYRLRVRNDGKTSKLATVRIYLAPKYNERGKISGNMTFFDQRRLWAEMDKFVVKLNPGKNLIERRSLDSSYSLPAEKAFRDLEEGRVDEPGDDEIADFNGCGWPHHNLVPRGMPGGMDYQVFVMIRDWLKDRLLPDQPPVFPRGSSVCGVLDRAYPDSRPMGFPFDRYPPEKETPIQNTQAFADAFDNMILQDVSINFLDKFLSE
uniref:Prophenoloxidase n=1 Tax=Nebalia kensleyi TaxID=586406 RepID=C8BP50_9CRUS|nr:prophenoloxidase [Nebalia kensleyi]